MQLDGDAERFGRDWEAQTEQLRFSVIIPSYNRPDEIIGALESVRKQEWPTRVEIIVVDDSDDDTAGRVREYAHSNEDMRIVLFRPRRRAGLSHARNCGIELSSGELLVFLDSDDELLPGALTRIHVVATEACWGVYFGGVRCKSGRSVRYSKAHSDRLLDFKQYVKSHRQPESLPVIRAKILKEHNLRYDSDLSGFESLLYLSILHRGYTLYRDSHAVRLFNDLASPDRHSAPRSILRLSERMAKGHARMIARYGDDMRACSLSLYVGEIAKTAVYCRISGVSPSELGCEGRYWRFVRLLPARLAERLAYGYKRMRFRN